MLYLDHNATTCVHPRVKELISGMLNKTSNPSSVHTFGREARDVVELARRQILTSLGIIGSREYQLIFTSSGTESNNLLLHNYDDGDIFISSIEHPSIYDHLKVRNNIKTINVDHDGVINLEHLEELLAASNNDRKLVSVMMANNESGVIQNMAEIAKIARKYSAELHSDCVQAAGKIPLNIAELDLDYATISAHKLGGIQGSGALIARSKHRLEAVMIGGGQERNIRSGTENVLSIAAFGLAMSIAAAELEERYGNMQKLQRHLEGYLYKYEQIRIVSKNVTRLPNTTMILVPGTSAETKLIALDLQGIAVSNGSACSSGKVGKSHVLLSMGYNNDEAKSAIRISFNHQQTIEDVKTFIQAFETIYSQELVCTN